MEKPRSTITASPILDRSWLIPGRGGGPIAARNMRAVRTTPPRPPSCSRRISPIGSAGDITAPLLVLHGTRDPRVPFGQSEQIVAALQTRDHPVRFERFDYAGHGFIRPADRCRAFAAVAAFLQAWL